MTTKIEDVFERTGCGKSANEIVVFIRSSCVCHSGSGILGNHSCDSFPLPQRGCLTCYSELIMEYAKMVADRAVYEATKDMTPNTSVEPVKESDIFEKLGVARTVDGVLKFIAQSDCESMGTAECEKINGCGYCYEQLAEGVVVEVPDVDVFAKFGIEPTEENVMKFIRGEYGLSNPPCMNCENGECAKCDSTVLNAWVAFKIKEHDALSNRLHCWASWRIIGGKGVAY
jgi:hypothetical protein